MVPKATSVEAFAVDLRRQRERTCPNPVGARGFCAPSAHRPISSTAQPLFRPIRRNQNRNSSPGEKCGLGSPLSFVRRTVNFPAPPTCANINAPGSAVKDKIDLRLQNFQVPGKARQPIFFELFPPGCDLYEAMAQEPIEWLGEQVLVTRCQMGDEFAFERLLKRYHARLSYFVRQMAGASADSEDILQEIWIAVFRKIGTLSSPRAFPARLYRIARNKVYSALRKRTGFTPLSEVPETADEREDEDDFGPEDAARIHASLRKIRPEHREVLILRYLAEMSYERIASTTGSTLGTVRSRLHYAKRSLRRAMERIDHEPENDSCR